jgi:hypothetical protein
MPLLHAFVPLFGLMVFLLTLVAEAGAAAGF